MVARAATWWRALLMSLNGRTRSATPQGTAGAQLPLVAVKAASWRGECATTVDCAACCPPTGAVGDTVAGVTWAAPAREAPGRVRAHRLVGVAVVGAGDALVDVYSSRGGMEGVVHAYRGARVMQR